MIKTIILHILYIVDDTKNAALQNVNVTVVPKYTLNTFQSNFT